MQASKSLLRLLSLGACAELVLSFGTFKMGADDNDDGEASLSVESAPSRTKTAPSCPCTYNWICKVEGQSSLSDPMSGAYTNNALARHINFCWNMCYKNPGYMADGSKGAFYDGCSDGPDSISGEAERWRVALCTPSNGFLDTLKLSATSSNPFKDSENAPNSMYTENLCTNLGGQDDDTRSEDERCSPITREGGIYFKKDNYDCQSAMDANLGDCDKLYTYVRAGNNRMAEFCAYDSSTGTCATEKDSNGQDYSVVADACQRLLCGTFAPGKGRLTDGTDNDNAACTIPMP